MNEAAFSAGIRPGGLTDETQIRILLCYIVKNFSPVTAVELQDALWSKQLINCFELHSALEELCRLGHISENDDGFSVCPSGALVANDLITAVPLSVRDRAMDAMLRLRAGALNAVQNRAEIHAYGNEFLLRCKIDDLGRTLMDCTLAFPDLEIAEHAKQRFIGNGEKIYRLLVAGMTNDKLLALSAFEPETDKKSDLKEP